MSAYHQMGHDSRNLLYEQHLGLYKGAILSPVNSTEAEVADIIAHPPRIDFEFIFDPQLYFPTTDRGSLPEWSYFPTDVDTADQASLPWWESLVSEIASCATRLNLSGICSPAIVPRVYSLEYYSHCRRIAQMLQDALAGSESNVFMTLFLRLEDLASPGKAAELSSLLTTWENIPVYLVFNTDVAPRRELADVEAIKGLMRLIRFLEDSGLIVLVGYSSSDLVLWKTAGATSVATGKFFNLRRFTPSRWEPPPGGGGQVPYWFEESVMAFLRESDVARLRLAGYLSPASMSNPYGQEIIAALDAPQHQPWQGLSWRQYLYWFADFEARIESGQITPATHLADADKVWSDLDNNTILMEERANDGTWVREWRRAIAEAFR